MALMLQRQFRKQGDKLYKYYSIAEPYYEDGKNKKRVLARLGELSDEQAGKIKSALKLKNHAELGVYGLKDLSLLQSWSYLDLAFVKQILDELGIASLIPESRSLLSPQHAFSILVIHRILKPGSKLQATRWLKNTALPSLLGIDKQEIQSQHLYRSLEDIERAKPELEQHLFQHLKKSGQNLDCVFYDMSSSYFEGSEVEDAAFNLHSKDHRPDCLQLQLGLLVSPDGFPFSWDLFPGNQGESPTMIEQVSKLKKRFGLQKTLLVFDRGFLSEKNLKWITENEYDYLTALDSPQVKTLVDTFLGDSLSLLNESNVHEILGRGTGIQGKWTAYDENKYYFHPLVEEIVVNGSRVALSFDVERFLRQRMQRGLKLNRFKAWVEKHNLWLSDFKKDAERSAIEKDVEAELKRLGLKDYVKYELHEYSNEGQIFIRHKNNPFPSQGYTRKVKTLKIVFRFEVEEKMDGVFALISSPGASLSAQQMVFHYREKYRIEEVFRNLKSLLKLRPWFVYKQEHVEAHYTICVVAYFIKKLIDQKLTRAGLKEHGYTTERLLEELEIVRLGKLGLGDQSKLALTETPASVAKLLKDLAAENLLKTPSFSL
jgi:transposase